ncbi:dipeptide/oligopeptide/nickel ABC transporter permease/ATP-binding protein [Conexibacter woesei]|uniref:Oligopeptide/dipeptide ABC transporter, ATPase subunit n=1 Tax=Conexibacter woesei (strain DSM 14684 / CCUG 47730 / CIP 108061 / JCM 11494 / NBRC 100937 / ID131577) TaxID=469383 RepID=D3FEK7_CONWI|nr:dipeptide/oligopeptide/nickel ABC transporter permease/ATP-binding protein [Conexibacter woesei]ADB49681.1 oligopeptide/dipeptide ABC transporter, ATPase subunit [Conexibacter woesei DSM 14684]
MRRLRRPSVVLGLAIVTLLLLCTLFAGLLAPHDPNAIAPSEKFLPPAWEEGGDASYLLGTDQLGRDVLSRLIYGARTSLMIAGVAVVLAAAFGIAMGMLSGFYRGWVDTVIMRLADVQLAFPFILLALAILAVSDTKSAIRIIFVLAIADWVIHARVVRSRVLVEREKEYVRGARALGASNARIMLRYILPSVLPTALVIALIELAVLMLLESILAFLGLGIDPPAVSWGTVLADGRENVAIAWWMLVFPGMAIFLAVLAMNLVADGLADVLDPRLKLTGRFARGAARKRERPVVPVAGGSPLVAGAVADASADPPLLAVAGLRVEFPTDDGPVVQAVQDVSFSLRAGERVGIVGESGSGKSVSALAIMGLLDAPGRVAAGSVRLRGRELLDCSERELNKVRGRELGMIFQDPGSSLNPVFKIGWQVAEAIELHQECGKGEARRRAIEALRLVNIRDPERVADCYPFEVSGGMQQRVMIAMALSCRPGVLIADEPTTALDVTTQAQILRELDALVDELDTGVVLITHDLGVVAEFTDRTIVMYAGSVCESGPTEQLIAEPRHPYTRALLDAVRELEGEEGVAETVRGEPLDPRDRPPGCPFAPRCPLAMDVCREQAPRLVGEDGEDGERAVACFAANPEEVSPHEHAARR